MFIKFSNRSHIIKFINLLTFILVMDKILIRKYALQNAIKFNGKANPGAVIGKIISEKPELKSQLKELAPEINKVIADISKLSVEQQTKELETLAPELLIEKKVDHKKQVPEMKNAEIGKVIMRFEPSPSGPLHIGHAYVLGLNSEICKKYEGKLILRISDTNAENIYVPSYDLIPIDANWLTNNGIDEVAVQSDRMDLYYKYMDKLLDLDKVYVCTCDQELFKDLIKKCEPCPCRNLPKEEQILRWKKMFKGYEKGGAVARLKTDITHKNPAMRDFPIFRINDTPHPRQKKKYKVWPLMNMAVTVDDIEMGITHVIRGKDHYDNAERQKIMYGYLDIKFPETIFLGRINFEGMPVSCSKTRAGIEAGEYEDWEDIRLPFLVALRKRGYQPQAFLEYAIDVGVSLADKSVTKEDFFKTVNAHNKNIIEKSSFRYFFVWNPVKIEIKDSPDMEVKLDLHPDTHKGGRHLKAEGKFYITEQDEKEFNDNVLYRLMDCFNFRKKGKSYHFDSLEYEKYKSEGKKIMHWLPVSKDLIKVEVKLDDNSIAKGLGEHTLSKLKEGDIIQFERFGFVRLIKKGKTKYQFYFLHK